MNILIICNYHMYNDLGLSFIHQQAKAFVELGHHVTALIPIALGHRNYKGHLVKNYEHASEDGVHLVFLPYISLSRFGNTCGFNTSSLLHAIKRIFVPNNRELHPDVILSHCLMTTSAAGIYLKSVYQCPCVLLTHGSDVSIPIEQGRSAELLPDCNAADWIVAVSTKLAEKVRMCGTTTPVSTILNGFNVKNALIPGKKRKFSVIQVSHLTQQKRVHITIEAFAQVLHKYPEASLTIVGQGSERQSLEQLTEKLGIQKNVRFMGQLSNEEVFQELEGHQFFVMPSVREGFGIVYLEAMASGCLTIGTENEGISDFIVSGVNGFLVPPDDAKAVANIMEQCMDGTVDYESIAQRGHQDAMELTWERNAKQYINLFEEIKNVD